MSVSTSPTTIPLHVGAVLDRAPGPKYAAALAFAELAFRQPLPKPKVLAQIKRQAPEGFAFALRAPRECVVSKQGALRMTAEVEAGLAWLLAAADACAAKVVVIPTPADFTPGARSRDLLREFVGRLPRPDGRHYVWLPSGLWEPHETEVIAAELGIVCGFDPLESRRPAGPVAYGTLRAMGHRTSFSPAAMGDALATLLTAETREAFVSVDAERAFDVARRLSQLAASVFAEAAAAEDESDTEDSEGVDDADDDGTEDDDVDEQDEYAASDDADDDEARGSADDDDDSDDDDEPLDADDLGADDDEKPGKRHKQGKQGRP
jgi:uncharacterized protein YecE (DUF72 family)